MDASLGVVYNFRSDMLLDAFVRVGVLLPWTFLLAVIAADSG